MKAYTDIKQSKKLAKILPLESADMCYIANSELINIRVPFYKKMDKEDIPCWSLAALLDVLSYPSLHKTFGGWRCDSYNKEGTSYISSKPLDNPVDACVELIESLYRQNLL